MLDISKKFNLPEIEEKILDFWEKNKIFEKSVAQRRAQGKKPFRFFEGPPSANAKPGIHHVLSRSFKDIMLRYKTLRGFYAYRKAGWDTHGLPVEVQVEKNLGIKNKSEIEKLGIAEFNERARLLVWKYKSDWEKLSERIGFWIDFKNPYITYENSYIETLWWIFKRINESGLLKKVYKVVAWCPRCQTPLSNHELGQPGVYQRVKDPSVYIKFEVKPAGKARKTKEYFLVWTTTPWTLPANIAIAVNPKFTYTKYKVGNEFIWSHDSPPKIKGFEAMAVEKITGSKLVGRKYSPVYKNIGNQELASGLYKILGADFVSDEEGTGFVHIAPAFGEEDLDLILKAKSIKLPISKIPITIDEQGIVKKSASLRIPGAGKFIKEADKDIIRDLKKRKLLYLEERQSHEYPFCWRCESPLIYLARLTWFIEISKLKAELLDANRQINWIPKYIKNGRFGEWLKELKDWSISRERYWGTPLPIWEHASVKEGISQGPNAKFSNKCNNILVIGSFDELNKRRFNRNKFFIVRHGDAEHNLKKIISSAPETKKNASHLTKKGVLQAEKLAEDFKNKKIDIIFYSPFIRTKHTAEIIAGKTKAKLIADRRIRELNAGIFNGAAFKKFHKFFTNFEERFTKRPTNGESLTDVKRRMLQFITHVNNSYNNKNIVIVSHGAPLWMLDAISKGLGNNQISRSDHLKVGEYRELNFPNWPYNRDGILDYHRPFVDGLVLKCDKCGGRMRRVKGVADVWFDSGAMPFAQWHYPFENKELIDKRKQFPADYITEGIDQTRGWFYTLLAISTLLKKETPYLNVISLGLLLDKDGLKMSKSKGNVVNPWLISEKYGSDVLRWFFYTINNPGDQKRFDEIGLIKALRKFHTLFYNSFVFFRVYEKKSSDFSKFEPKNLKSSLDKWIIARLNQTILETTKKLDNYQIGQAARFIEELVDDLSHWYIRRSRRRFSHSEEAQDFIQAAKTLKFVLLALSKLTAPFCPFLSDAIYLSLIDKKSRKVAQRDRQGTRDKIKESVHLEDWPVFDKKLIDNNLLLAVLEARRLASRALALRAEAGIKVRQPLASLKISAKGGSASARKNFISKIKSRKELLEMLCEEVNVKKIIFDNKLKKDVELDIKITPELYKEGVLRELVRIVQKVRQDGGYKVADSINLSLKLPKEFNSVARENLKEFKKLVKAKKLELLSVQGKKSGKGGVGVESKLNGKSIFVLIKK